MVAETTSGCFISADTAVSYGRGEESGEDKDEENNELMPPEEVGEQIASVLLGEIEQGGVVDSTHQVGVLNHCTPLHPPQATPPLACSHTHKLPCITNNFEISLCLISWLDNEEL